MREFLKKSVAVVMAVTACLTVSVGSYIEKPVSALDPIPIEMEASVEKEVIAVGETTIIQTTLLNPEDWTGYKPNIQFFSSDESIASVTSNGIVTGIGEGTAEIIVASEYYSRICTAEITVLSDVKGDVNADGEFNVADAVLLQQWLSKKTDGMKGNADVNGDGKVNAFDLVLLKRMLMSQNKPDGKITWEIAPIANSDKFRDTVDKEYIITSTKELGDYFFSIYGGIIACDVVCPENETVTEFFNKYDYEFFENNVLLMKPFYQLHSNGNFPYAIEDVIYSGNTLCVYYTDNTYGECIEVFNHYLALVTVPKALYHAENVMWINVTIDFDGITEIKDGYIAVFHGIADDLMNETYIYKIDNGADNYGFEYINVSRSDLGIDHTERVTITGQGNVMWTDNVFQVAEANDAYDYVTVPNDETKYTIDEFMARFLMN